MTLQELIGELTTLSLAYPAESPVQIVVPAHSVLCPDISITAESADTGVTINIIAE